MGRAYSFTLTASAPGVDPQPISVSGQTIIYVDGVLEMAYDPADFDSQQYVRAGFGITGSRLMTFPPNTILWVRLDQTVPIPATRISVHTQINQEGV